MSLDDARVPPDEFRDDTVRKMGEDPDMQTIFVGTDLAAAELVASQHPDENPVVVQEDGFILVFVRK